VRREFSKTEDLLRNGPPQEAIEREAAAITIDADAGRWDEAAVRARTLLAKLQKPQQPFDWVGRSVVLAILQRTAPAKEVQAQAKSLLEASEHALPGSVGRAREAIANAALYAGYVAAGHGDAALVARALKITGPVIESAPQRGLANMAALAQARLSLTQGKAQAAVDVLQPYKGEDALLLTRLVRNQALEALHQAPESLDRDSMQWRGRAYAEWASEHPPVIETLVAR
jgi:hypothetical protein